jgi:hypothetical protein
MSQPSRRGGSGDGRRDHGGLWQPVAATITDKAAHATVKHALETNGARQALAKEGDACGGRASSGEKRANLRLGFLLLLLSDSAWVAHVRDHLRPRKHAKREACIVSRNKTLNQTKQSHEQLVAADAARGVRREAGMAKRGAHRRLVVLLLLKKPSVSVNVLGCFELQSEQLVDFEFLASREMREYVLRRLIVPFRGSPASYLVQPSFRLLHAPASCDETGYQRE